MEERDYELLLNSVFRNSATSRGVDADMYLMMVEAYQNIFTKSFYETHEERLIEFRRTFMVVREQVLDALAETGRMLLQKNVQEKDLDLVQTLLSSIDGAFFDKNALYTIIKQNLNILRKYSLTAVQGTNVYNIPGMSQVNNLFTN